MTDISFVIKSFINLLFGGYLGEGEGGEGCPSMDPVKQWNIYKKKLALCKL